MSFSRLATETASTKRPPAISGNKRGVPVTNISSLSCTPLDPVQPDLKARMGLNSPHELLQTFVTGAPDIVPGDVLVYGGKDYPVKAVGDWKWRSTKYVHLVLEDIKA